MVQRLRHSQGESYCVTLRDSTQKQLRQAGCAAIYLSIQPIYYRDMLSHPSSVKGSLGWLRLAVFHLSD
jgi:hypothetical protein